MQAKTPPGHIIQQRGEPGHFNPLQETQVNIQLLYRNQFQGEGTKNSTQKEYKSISEFVENLFIISLCLLLKQKWPEDALKRSAEFMFEEINATRQTKKNISKTGMSIYEKAL